VFVKVAIILTISVIRKFNGRLAKPLLWNRMLLLGISAVATAGQGWTGNRENLGTRRKRDMQGYW
jgi:hypothetical protein